MTNPTREQVEGLLRVADDPLYTSNISVPFNVARYLARTALAVMDAPVVPISRQVEFPASPPLSWDSPCFETTYARILECDESGMVPVPTKGE